MFAKNAPFLLAVQMDVPPEHAADFQHVYNHEHVPNLLKVPGVISIKRFQRAEVVRIALGGVVKELTFPTEPAFTAFYEIESPDVITSDAWSNAVELGQWPTLVRPFTTNRRHTLHRLITPTHVTG